MDGRRRRAPRQTPDQRDAEDWAGVGDEPSRLEKMRREAWPFAAVPQLPLPNCDDPLERHPHRCNALKLPGRKVVLRPRDLHLRFSDLTCRSFALHGRR